MSVSILGDNGQQLESIIAFLKLFDRRFSEQLREDNGIDKWPEELEIAYVQSVKSGSICRFLENLHSIPNFQDDTEEDWDDAENEAFLADELHRLFTTEAAAYEKLHTHQGRVIPKLLAQVEMDIAPPGSPRTPSFSGKFRALQDQGPSSSACRWLQPVGHGATLPTLELAGHSRPGRLGGPDIRRPRHLEPRCMAG